MVPEIIALKNIVPKVATIGTSIKVAEKHLKKGQLVAIPTETVYGLAANAFNENAIKQIFEVKNRPLYNPLIVHIANLNQLANIVTTVPANAIKLFKAFSPGPITLLLPKKDIIPNIVTAGLPDVAVRIPNHALTLALLQELSFPLAAPSANLFGYISPTKPAHVAKQLENKIPYILDGGNCSTGIESTVVGFDKQTGTPIIYRIGAISQQQIIDVTGACLLKKEVNNIAPVSPGMIEYHYSPNTRLLVTDLVTGTTVALKNKKIGLISFKNEYPLINVFHKIVLSKSGNLQEVAKNIYAALHEMDEIGLDLIIVEKLPEIGIGIAVNEKLEKAAGKTNSLLFKIKNSLFREITEIRSKQPLMPGHIIKQFRELRNYSQEYVAKKMGISQNAYSKIENNITQLTVTHVKHISTILDVPIIDLLRDDFEIHKPHHLNTDTVNRKDIIMYLHDLQHGIKLKKEEDNKLYGAIMALLQTTSYISEGIK